MIELRVKRTKRETLKEGLPDTAYNRIPPARYLQKDDRGEVVDSPEEMFRRVATNVAEPEKAYGKDASGNRQTSFA